MHQSAAYHLCFPPLLPSQQRHLTEAASESVYVTKDSLTGLVQSYYSNLQDIMKALEQDEDNIKQGERAVV